jgi:hypothetical protein
VTAARLRVDKFTDFVHMRNPHLGMRSHETREPANSGVVRLKYHHIAEPLTGSTVVV